MPDLLDIPRLQVFPEAGKEMKLSPGGIEKAQHRVFEDIRHADEDESEYWLALF